MMLKAILFVQFILLCNITHINSTPRIVGGSPATLEATKHQLSLREKVYEKFGFGEGHICGASVISSTIILTAAHCVVEYGVVLPASDYIVVGGTLNKNIETSNTIVRNIVRIVAHNNYDENTFLNDIALLEIDHPIPENHPFVQPIPLTTTPIQVGTACSVTGWGTTTYQGMVSNILLTAAVGVIDKQTCELGYGSGSIRNGMFCAGVPEGGRDACQGDSGGPLVSNGRLIGIVSNGVDCGLFTFPGIYTDVYIFRDWIQYSIQEIGSFTYADAKSDDAPFQISIREKSRDVPSGNGYICNGALISQTHVLTSAECIRKGNTYFTSSELNIHIGNIERNSPIYVADITDIKIHEDYNPSTKQNDLAILTLASAVNQIKNQVEIIKLRTNAVPANAICTVSTWGAKNENEVTKPDKLQIFYTAIYNENSVNCAPSTQNPEYLISSLLLCAGMTGQVPTNDVCTGNLGAPMTYNNELAGIVSYEKGCGKMGAPIIYTNVYAARKWIMDNSDSKSTNILPSSITLLLSIIIALGITAISNL